jgi:hypothetical protein
MQFLYPKSRQFPFDEVCEQIVRALEARAWKVPGLSVEFRTYGSGAQKLRYVSLIMSDHSANALHDVVIKFGRPQGQLPGGRWNDTAAVDEVQLAEQSLRVYSDESSPTYYVYVGADWEHDRTTWWSRPNARLNEEPRVCVKYSGRVRWRGVRAATLAWDQDEREYGPEGNEPRSFDTAKVMEEFRLYLRDVVLPSIEEYPVVEIAEATAIEPPIPMPDGVGPFFTYCDGCDERRISMGKKALGELALADQYGLSGGRRLAPLGIKRGPDLPMGAYDGFLWCGATPNVPSEHGHAFANVLIKVSPKDARGIYVADHATYEKRRAELAVEFKGQRDRFTGMEVDDFVRARACTIVSILDYKGNYEDPVYLINRELDLDEVEVIGRSPD